MKHIIMSLSLIAGGFLSQATYAQTPSSTTPPPALVDGGWSLVFSDEFEGNALDANKWVAYRDCWGGGNKERQCYTGRPQNISVHDGALDLTARFEQATGPSLPLDQRKEGVPTPPATKPFTSGKISTFGKFSFTYGRVEVRAKLPQGQGVWPAIWLLPEKNLYGEWPGSGEIDIMESVNTGVKCGDCYGGVQNNVYATLHYGSNMHHQWQQKGYMLPKHTEADWHVYRMDWTPNKMRWYVDGNFTNEISLSNWRDPLQKNASQLAPALAKAPFDRPFYLIMNFSVGGEWPESHDLAGVVLKDYPKSLLVDWVHIYQCHGAVGNSGLCTAQ